MTTVIWNRLMVVAIILSASLFAFAQSPAMQQKLAEIKQASAMNKQSLAQYTWQEQDTISLKGEVKKQEVFQVRMGPDGKPQKTSLNPEQPQQPASGHHGRLKEHVVEKKTEEYKEYAHNIAALAHSYAQPNPELLQEAFQKGNLTFASGAPNEIRVAITNYLKPNDSVTIIFDRQAKAIQSIQIASYMDQPSDEVKISLEFSKLPDGTNHVSGMNIDGASKQLGVAVQNSNYQKL
jgi:23S rRNA pseudoU1915 N3-methylase RlmH